MIRKEFCTYEVSKALYDLGFDYACIGSYTDPETFNFTEGALMYRVFPSEPEFCLAPLRQQAFEWLREKYKYMHSIDDIGVCAGDNNEWGWRFKFSFWRLLDAYNALYMDESTLGYLTYEQAEEKCIMEIIVKIKALKK